MHLEMAKHVLKISEQCAISKSGKNVTSLEPRQNCDFSFQLYFDKTQCVLPRTVELDISF